MQAVGTIIGAYQDLKTGRIDPVLKKKNLILYEGADIMAGLLAGRSNFAPSHMYFQYRNTSDGSFSIDQTIDRTTGRASFNSITGVDPAEDWLRVPMITTPKTIILPDGSSNYTGNGVWFTATNAAAPSQLGQSPAQNPFTSDGPTPSYVFSVALVAAPVPADSAQDKIFSRVNLDSPFELLPGRAMCFYWLLNFN